jgi:DNA-binding response OmpR family regulator
MATVLIADDDEVLVDSLSAILRQHYTILTASTLEHAEQVVRGIRLDLVLLDVNFGREHSLTLAKRIRQRGIGVLLISGKSWTADLLAERGLTKEDGIRVLAKSIAPLELLLEVEAALQQERMMWEASSGRKPIKIIIK